MTPRSLTDCTGRYRLLFEPLLMLPDEHQPRVQKLLSTAIGQYRPLPQARAFHYSRARNKHAIGGNRCLGPDTLIDCPGEHPRRVADITTPHQVWSWNGELMIEARAEAPWIKGYEECFRFHLNNGLNFDCSAEHQIRVLQGWERAGNLSAGSLLKPCDADYLIVEDIEILGRRPIYDFEVPIYHNYCAAGAIHHNSSKSESLLVDGLLQALDLHPVISRPKPMNIWYASKTFQLIGQFLYPKLEKYLADWPCTWSWHSRRENIPASVRINNHYRDALITFRAYEQGRETFQAAELDLALFDEQYPEDIYIETQTRKGAGRLLYFGSAVTPIDPQPWYEEIIMGKLPSNMEVFNYPLDDNRTSRGGFIADEEIDAMIEIWPEEVVETRRNGKFGSYIGAIYQSFARTTHVVPENMEHLFLNRTGKTGQTIIDPRSYAIGAIDWGGANPMAVLWACRIPHMDDCWYIFDEYYWDSRKRGQRRLEDHATEIKTRTSERWETVLARTYADHDPTDAYEMFGHGVPSTPAEKAVKPGIEHMQTLFKLRRDHAHPWIPGLGRPRIFIAERCENLARQLSTYHWSEGVSGKNAKEEPAKVDDHACFVASTRIETLRGKVPINEVEVGDMALTREGFRKVTHVMRTSPDCAVIGRGFSDGTYLYGTANHPIWVVGLGWKPLGELLSSDIVEGLDGHRINVLPLSRGAKRQSVFNITVDYAHEYYANGILSGNCDASRYLVFSDRLNGPDGGTIEVLDTSGESWNQRTF